MLMNDAFAIEVDDFRTGLRLTDIHRRWYPRARIDRLLNAAAGLLKRHLARVATLIRQTLLDVPTDDPIFTARRQRDDGRPPVVPLDLLTDRTPAGPPHAPALRHQSIRRAAQAAVTT